jgi:hypothetical protein
VALLLSACAQPAETTTATACEPTTPGSVGLSGDPNTVIEDIIEYLTGERAAADEDVAVEEKVDDPNFGGVWGDFHGGVVVAVLDCSKVDANRLAEMAGGSDSLHLIEVRYTYRQTEEFRDALEHDLEDLDIPGDVSIESTLTGREITVHVLDVSAVPSALGEGIPDDAYEVTETDTVGTLAG